MPRERIHVSQGAYWVALAALFLWAGWLRSQVPLEPISDPDVWGYLSPAINHLLGHGFTHSGRTFVYPGFLYLILRATGDFRAIVLVQHALGLLAGVLLLLIWQRARDLVVAPRLSAAAYRWLGLLPAALYLLAADTVRFELQIRPEGICGFLGTLNFFLVLQFIYWFFVRENRRAAVIYGIGSILSVLLFGSARPNFWLAALGSLLPIGLLFFRRGWFKEKMAIVLGVMAGLALFILPERLLGAGDDVARMFVPTLLFTGHADLIRDQMAADLAAGADLPYEREWLQRIHLVLADEIQKSFAADPQHYPSLGFDPEYLIYREDSVTAVLTREFGDDVGKLCEFYRFYYGRVALNQPMRMLGKIAGQMALFYRPQCGAYNCTKHLSLRADYDSSVSEMTGLLPHFAPGKYEPMVDYIRRIGEIPSEATRMEQRAYIRVPLMALRGSYLFCLATALFLCVLILLRKTWRRRWSLLAGIVLLSYWYNFATCFENAALNSLEVFRYLTVQLCFTILAQFLTLAFALEVLTSLWRSPPENRTPVNWV